MLKVDNVIFKHKGMLADSSTKVELLLPELDAETAGQVSEYHKQRVGTFYFLSEDEAEKVGRVLQQAVNY